MDLSEVRGQKSGVALVCFALKEEAGAFREIAADRPDVSILITGIGQKNAAKSVQELLDGNSPRFVLTCGFAGGLKPQLAVGAVVFATEDAALAEKLLSAGAAPAIFFCASKVATTASEKQELRRHSGADAVEMESQAIHALCRERKIPCATVRAISDAANEDLPLDFNALANADLSLNYGKLAVAIAKTPGKIPVLMRLQKNCRLAAENLARVLEQVIASR